MVFPAALVGRAAQRKRINSQKLTSFNAEGAGARIAGAPAEGPHMPLKPVVRRDALGAERGGTDLAGV